MLGLLALYWVNLLVLGPIRPVQALLGGVLVLFIPGFLFVHAFDAAPERWGLFVASVVGASAVITAVSVVGTAVILSYAGVGRPLSAVPLAVTVTVLVLGLLGVFHVRHRGKPRISVDVPRNVGPKLLLFTLPLLGVTAAALMRWSGSNLGSFLLVGTVAVGILGLRRFEPNSESYALFVFTVALALLLHRNLTSPHIIGADIQGLYAVADTVFATGAGLTAATGIGASIPMMTHVPAAIATLLATPLAVTFKLFFVLLFAFVPLGVYYFGEELFDERVALFGALFFTLYHLSFTLTPGKQLVAELFAVLSLLALSIDSPRSVQPVLLGLFSMGIVLTHYGVAYIFGLSLLFAAVVLAVARRFLTRFDGRISLVYPVVFLGSASAWYAVTSPDLLGRIFAIPQGVLAQIPVLLSGGSIERSGSTFVSGDTTLLQYGHILLYAGLAALIAIGLFWVVVTALRRRAGSRGATTPEYAAIAVPFFVFLGASYFFVLNLWADRVFQLALFVLAPLAPVGYSAVTSRLGRLVPARNETNVGGGGVGRPSVVLVAFLVALLLFSSGAVFAASGDASLSTFDENANDLSFDDADMAAVDWLRANGEISRTEGAVADDGTRLAVDAPSQVQIYTDPTSFHLLRSTLPSQYYSTELVQLKNQWQPTVAVADLEPGYVFLRAEAIVDAPATAGPFPSQLTTEEVALLTERGTVVYDRDGVTIVEIPERDG